MEKALNVLKDLCLVINFNSYWKPRVDEAIAELEEAMKTKDEEIERLKAIVEEAVRKPMGVEPHSWSDYKMNDK